MNEIPADPGGAGLELLASLGERRTFSAGQMLLRQGDPGNALHILLSGRVRIERHDPQLAGTIVLAELGPGEVVGEMGVLDGQARSASVIAIESTETLEVALDSPQLSRTLLQFPEVSAALLRVASRRLRTANEAAPSTAKDEFRRLKSEWVTIASHELRTPLTTILGFSELLLAQTQPAHPNHHLLSVLHEDAKLLVGLVENLEDASRLESGRMALDVTPIDLAPVLHGLVGRVSSQAPERRFDLRLEEGLPRVRADQEKLEQIVENLVSNAVKYSALGSRIGIATARAAAPGFVEIAVSDEGIGIPAMALGKIFDRFERVENEQTTGIRGAGLGLYIVRHLVELHGGTIDVESTLGQGSVFRVCLPSVDTVSSGGRPPVESGFFDSRQARERPRVE